MKIETILNAMQKVRVGSGWDMDRRMRQIAAFRAQILRMDAEKKELIDKLFKIIGDRERIIREKDARIAELEASLKLRDEVLADYEIDWELWRE